MMTTSPQYIHIITDLPSELQCLIFKFALFHHLKARDGPDRSVEALRGLNSIVGKNPAFDSLVAEAVSEMAFSDKELNYLDDFMDILFKSSFRINQVDITQPHNQDMHPNIMKALQVGCKQAAMDYSRVYGQEIINSPFFEYITIVKCDHKRFIGMFSQGYIFKMVRLTQLILVCWDPIPWDELIKNLSSFKKWREEIQESRISGVKFSICIQANSFELNTENVEILFSKLAGWKMQLDSMICYLDKDGFKTGFYHRLHARDIHLKTWVLLHTIDTGNPTIIEMLNCLPGVYDVSIDLRDPDNEGPIAEYEICFSNPETVRLSLRNLKSVKQISFKAMTLLSSLTLTNCPFDPNMHLSLSGSLRTLLLYHINFLNLGANIKFPKHLKRLGIFGNSLIFWDDAQSQSSDDSSLDTTTFDISKVEDGFTLSQWQEFIDNLPESLPSLRIENNTYIRQDASPLRICSPDNLTYDRLMDLRSFAYKTDIKLDDFNVSSLPPSENLLLKTGSTFTGFFSPQLESINISLEGYRGSFPYFCNRFIASLTKLTTFECHFGYLLVRHTVDFRNINFPPAISAFTIHYPDPYNFTPDLNKTAVYLIFDKLPKSLSSFKILDGDAVEIIVDDKYGETIESVKDRLTKSDGVRKFHSTNFHSEEDHDVTTLLAKMNLPYIN
ncbi:unnamed protein product [Ambrosiozyma monospora]|uniref:Unnamed protein product n=1 Tax=Ambrosiozyma monospora TaxID=43982 RepID=A0ACB5T3G8_AMBMO|nr:unnamed protein product [Ambrosiozyma monospora]